MPVSDTTAPTTTGCANAVAMQIKKKKNALVVKLVVHGVAALGNQARALESHEHGPVRFCPRGAHGDDAVVRPRARLALADDLGFGIDRVSREYRGGEPDLVPAEIGERLLTDVRHAHAGNDGECQAGVDQRAAELGGGAVGGVD